jgi:hypothetical protein
MQKDSAQASQCSHTHQSTTTITYYKLRKSTEK